MVESIKPWRGGEPATPLEPDALQRLEDRRIASRTHAAAIANQSDLNFQYRQQAIEQQN